MSSLPVVTKFKVEADWIDENEHMNFGRYFDIFVEASNKISFELGFDDDDYFGQGYTSFAGDYHVTFLNEATLGDRLLCKSYVLAVNDKKLVLRHELMHAEENWMSAVAEELVLSVSLETRRVCSFPDKMYQALSSAALSPEELKETPNRERFVSLNTPGPTR